MSADRLFRDHTAPLPVGEALDRLLDHALAEMKRATDRDVRLALADACREIQRLRTRLTAC